MTPFTLTRQSNATHVVDGVLIEVGSNIPRTSSSGILVESSSTNLFDNSIDLYLWAGGSNVTSNTEPAPDTTNTASILSGTITEAISANTISIHCKGAPVSMNTNASTAIFDPLTNTVSANTNCDYTFEELSNGWFRASVTSENINSISLSSDGGTIWGAQAEHKRYVTSFIYTRGTSETRNADSITLNANLITQTVGTIFMDVELLAYNLDRDLRLVDFNTVGAAITPSSGDFEIANNVRLAFSYDRDNLIARVGDATVSHNVTLLDGDYFYLGSSDAELQFDGYIREFAYWPNTLDDRYLHHAVL